MGFESIFVLTTRTMHWFIKRGFEQVDPDWLPEAQQTQIQLGPAFAGAGQETGLIFIIPFAEGAGSTMPRT